MLASAPAVPVFAGASRSWGSVTFPEADTAGKAVSRSRAGPTIPFPWEAGAPGTSLFYIQSHDSPDERVALAAGSPLTPRTCEPATAPTPTFAEITALDRIDAPERDRASNGPRSPLTCCKLPFQAALKPRARTSGMTSRRNHNRQPRMASKTNNCYRVCQVRDTTRARTLERMSCCTQFNH